MKAQDILANYLRENNYDGLCHPRTECGCGVDDLIPCGEYCGDCEPAVLSDNPPEDCDRWYVRAEK
jgi:hypothetical protein